MLIGRPLMNRCTALTVEPPVRGTSTRPLRGAGGPVGGQRSPVQVEIAFREDLEIVDGVGASVGVATGAAERVRRAPAPPVAEALLELHVEDVLLGLADVLTNPHLVYERGRVPARRRVRAGRSAPVAPSGSYPPAQRG